MILHVHVKHKVLSDIFKYMYNIHWDNSYSDSKYIRIVYHYVKRMVIYMHKTFNKAALYEHGQGYKFSSTK